MLKTKLKFYEQKQALAQFVRVNVGTKFHWAFVQHTAMAINAFLEIEPTDFHTQSTRTKYKATSAISFYS